MDTTSDPPSDPSTPTRTKWLLAALGAVLLLGTTVGIVSAQEADESNGDDGVEQQGPSDEDRAAFEAFRDCLADNGVERPEDGERPDPGSITEDQRETFKAAREECADEHPFAEEIEAFKACLAENDVELPEDGERPDRDSITEEQREAFRAAREACADESPFAGHGPGGRRGFGPGPRGFGPGGPGFPGGGDEAPAGFPGGGPGALQGA